MAHRKAMNETGEPVGIGIVAPRRPEVAPRLLAYVWAPAPEPAAAESGPEALAA